MEEGGRGYQPSRLGPHRAAPPLRGRTASPHKRPWRSQSLSPAHGAAPRRPPAAAAEEQEQQESGELPDQPSPQRQAWEQVEASQRRRPEELEQGRQREGEQPREQEREQGRQWEREQPRQREREQQRQKQREQPQHQDRRSPSASPAFQAPLAEAPPAWAEGYESDAMSADMEQSPLHHLHLHHHQLLPPPFSPPRSPDITPLIAKVGSTAPRRSPAFLFLSTSVPRFLPSTSFPRLPWQPTTARATLPSPATLCHPLCPVLCNAGRGLGHPCWSCQPWWPCAA